MKNFILINIFKFIYKLFPNKILRNKINTFYLEKANQLIIKLTEVKKNSFSSKEIERVFLSFGIKLKVKDYNFYKILLDYLTGYDEEEKNKKILINQINNLPSNSTEFHSWLRLRDLFYLKSKIILGGICRKKAVESTLKSKVGFFLSKKDKARSRLDKTLNVKNIQDYLNNNKLEYNFDKRVYRKFMNSVHQIKYENSSYTLKKNEKKYFEILENKNVAIVGPSYTEKSDGAEIDSFDLVLRLNHISQNEELDIHKKGSRTDITYINGLIFSDVFEKKIKISNQIKYIIIKSNNLNKIRKFQSSNPDLIIKQIDNYNFFSYYSSFNLLPLVLLDLLETNLNKIKIFHSDLFLKKRDPRYLTDYFPNNMSEKNKKQLSSFLNHDPLCQHEYLKKLYENEKVFGDKIFDKIMKLNTHDYLEKLENNYK